MAQQYVSPLLLGAGPTSTSFIAGIKDANNHIAVGMTEYVQLPSGLLLPKATDINGMPLHTSRVTTAISTTLLAASGEYTQPWVDAESLAVTYLAGSVTADQAGTLVVNFSDDGVHVAASQTVLAFTPATAGTANAQAIPHPVQIPTQYFQFVYTNGITAQGTFALYQTPLSDWSPRDVGLTGSLALYSGAFDVPTTAGALPSQAGSEVLIQAAVGNANNVSVGTATGQPISLSPGQSVSLSIVNLNLVWAVATATGNTLGWVVRS